MILDYKGTIKMIIPLFPDESIGPTEESFFVRGTQKQDYILANDPGLELTTPQVFSIILKIVQLIVSHHNILWFLPFSLPQYLLLNHPVARTFYKLLKNNLNCGFYSTRPW